ncbi:polysaccharide pyruvyl transferase family protein [Pedobacter antarcticus]|uniref:polysaccharide pyruvyl transferase family protein n=1 Tax=Pedobacter antarcticus TaxID=34086 RepID=UPI0008915F6C|nr:polysaccharide pyruvyl transferase family protein [Pedobacter antarcticus]SDM17333.1 Polysaccharide pyruvyl transferase family protein WcaK [Pedobacter antarcticus]
MIHSDILFTGYYGHLNTGDDAFVEVVSWGADTFWKKRNNRFLGMKSKLPRTIMDIKGYPIEFPKTYHLQKKILVRNTDYLISAGGSTIHSKLDANNAKQYAIDLKNKGKRIKIGAIGVSVGPFKTISDEKAVQKYLKEIDFIALRDKRSYDYVKSLDTPYQPVNAFDLAALMPEMYGYNYIDRASNAQKTIGISVCPYESLHRNGNVQNEKRRNSQIINLIKLLNQKEDILFKFYIINGNVKNGDRELTLEIIQNVQPKKYEIIEYNEVTRATWHDINSCDTVIATRLHAAIFACFGQTPFMLVEYHKKCSDFLEDIGQNDDARIYDAEFDIEEKTDIILGWISNRNLFPKLSLLSEKVEQAKLNFSAINI